MRSMAGGEVKLFNVAGATKDTIDALDEVNGVSGLYLACSLLGCSCVLCDAPVSWVSISCALLCSPALCSSIHTAV